MFRGEEAHLFIAGAEETWEEACGWNCWQWRVCLFYCFKSSVQRECLQKILELEKIFESSASLLTKEMHIKNKMRHYDLLTRIFVIETTTNTRVWLERGVTHLLLIVAKVWIAATSSEKCLGRFFFGGGMLGREVSLFFMKLNKQLLWLCNSTLRYLPKKMEICPNKVSYHRSFIQNSYKLKVT